MLRGSREFLIEINQSKILYNACRVDSQPLTHTCLCMKALSWAIW